jgi:hypothetical protein
VQIDNERVRVIEWRFAAGAATGWHRHEHEYVVVPLTTGRLLLEEPGGTSRHAELLTGVSYFRAAGVSTTWSTTTRSSSRSSRSRRVDPQVRRTPCQGEDGDSTIGVEGIDRVDGREIFSGLGDSSEGQLDPDMLVAAG